MTATGAAVLLGGGGTGGHIFPNVGILEALRRLDRNWRGQFVVSNREIDARILQQQKLPYTAIAARPISLRPWRWPAFVQGWRQSAAVSRQLIEKHQPRAVVVTGGFVCGPLAHAAWKAGVPVALVNLDAAPGKANRLMARRATVVFSAYQTDQLPGAQLIGVPLRAAASVQVPPADARRQLGLEPDRHTLLITGASQGAESVNQLMVELLRQATTRAAMRSWQVLHLAGGDRHAEQLQQSYDGAKVAAKVLPFLDEMSLAWSAADMAVSRAGAGSVAEVWAHHVPTIFLPYPYHRDQHQRLNAAPLVAAGAAKMFADLVDAPANVRQLAGPLMALMSNDNQRRQMRQTMQRTCPPDGANAVAQWLANLPA